MPAASPSNSAHTPADILVIGGGVAGLWTAAHLARMSHHPKIALIERSALGDAQSIASQGIIHGGIKYALTGTASAASKAIAAMPTFWAACLNGDTSRNPAALDLRSVRILSDHQYLWSTAGIGSRLAAVAASKVIRTGVARIPRDTDEWSHLLNVHARAHAAKSIDLYRVEEAVLDAHSVLAALRTACELAGVVFLSRGTGVGGAPVLLPPNLSHPHSRWRIELPTTEPHPQTIIDARHVVLCAGAGNEQLLADAHEHTIKMQRRPLHMVMLRFPTDTTPPTLFGHCLAGSFSDKPRLTVTTHTTADTLPRTVWYLGGTLAEEGVNRSPAEQITAAQREVAMCVPWVDLAGTEWSTLRVDRAEGLTPDGKRPDQPVVRSAFDNTLIAAWPTKLVFAPLVATQVRELLEPALDASTGAAAHPACASSTIPVAPLPWDDERGGTRWN